MRFRQTPTFAERRSFSRRTSYDVLTISDLNEFAWRNGSAPTLEHCLARNFCKRAANVDVLRKTRQSASLSNVPIAAVITGISVSGAQSSMHDDLLANLTERLFEPAQREAGGDQRLPGDWALPRARRDRSQSAGTPLPVIERLSLPNSPQTTAGVRCGVRNAYHPPFVRRTICCTRDLESPGPFALKACSPRR
jgi:hypothetical protein